MNKLVDTIASALDWTDEEIQENAPKIKEMGFITEPVEHCLCEIAEDRGWDNLAFVEYVSEVVGVDHLDAAIESFEEAWMNEGGQTFSSLGEFIDAYNEEVYGSEYTEWLDKARQFGYLTPDWETGVDETSVRQDFTLTTSGFVFRNN